MAPHRGAPLAGWSWPPVTALRGTSCINPTCCWRHSFRRRKLLPRSGASITYVPGPGGGPGSVYLFGGQEPTSGAIFDDLLVSRWRSSRWVAQFCKP